MHFQLVSLGSCRPLYPTAGVVGGGLGAVQQKFSMRLLDGLKGQLLHLYRTSSPLCKPVGMAVTASCTLRKSKTQKLCV